MDIKLVISIKYDWTTIAWADDISFKIHSSTKISTFCRHFKGTKTHMSKILGIWYFFIWKRQGYVDIAGAKNNFGLHHLHTQILQRNCRWNCRNETKNKSEKWNFWEAVSHFVFDINFRIFLLWESYHRDKMIKTKKVSYF